MEQLTLTVGEQVLVLTAEDMKVLEHVLVDAVQASSGRAQRTSASGRTFTALYSSAAEAKRQPAPTERVHMTDRTQQLVATDC